MNDDTTGLHEPDRRAVLILDARGLHLEPADATDHDHDPAADLPWGDDAPLPPYPVIATDPDPGAPMTRPTDPEEELLRLRDEVNRLTAALTESEARCDALADRVTAAEGRLELATMKRQEVARG